MGLQPLYGKWPYPLLRAGLWAACAKITIIGIPNCLNYCVIFTVHTQFANVAMGCVIQFGGPQAGDPCAAG